VLEKAFVDVAGTDVASWWTGPWQTLVPLHVPAYAGVRPLFDELQRRGQRGGPAGARLCALVTEQIAVLAAAEAVDVDRSHSAAWSTYVGCRNVIETRYLELATLGDIARECHVGEAWLCRLFVQFDSDSPYQILVKRKMAHAASRLADRGVLVKQVAAEVGYDPYHFSRVFKKVTGFSPEAFRQFERVGGASNV
jgi:AraC-like DNA-binding protein